MTNLPISNIVNVRVTSTPTWPEGPGFGTLLLISRSHVLPRGDSLRYYQTLSAVAADFGTLMDAYKAAEIYFSQDPGPRTLGIGRWWDEDTPAELLSSRQFCTSMDTWQKVKDGFFSLTIDGAPVALQNLDFSACTDLDMVARVLTLALGKKALCQFNGQNFILSTTSKGEKARLSRPEKGKIGTDVAQMLGMHDAQTSPLTQGAKAETIAQALTRLSELSSKWYGVTLLETRTDQEIEAASDWTQTQSKVLGYTTADPNVTVRAITTDIASRLQSKKHRRTIGIYEPENPYAIISVLARAFAVDFDSPDSTITLKFKTLPSIGPAHISGRDADVLQSKNINYYTKFGESAMLAEGVMANGTFFDEVHGLDWFSSRIETNLFGLLFTSVKVPQNDRGIALLTHQVEKACASAVFAGLLSPGTWNGPPLGQVQTGDFLPKGFYIWTDLVSMQAQSDREQRRAPIIKILAKGSGSIHFANIVATFER